LPLQFSAAFSALEDEGIQPANLEGRHIWCLRERGTPEFKKSKRRNTMSEDIKKVEKIEQVAKASELSQQDLDKVAGGAGAIDWSGPGDEGPEEIVITKPIKPF
jgi:hypothetical protein